MSDAGVRVLLVEDDEDDYLLVRDYLAEAGEGSLALEWAATYEAGLAALARRAHDVVLVDYRLGARSGLDLLLAARAAGDLPPAIVLTGARDRALDAAALAAGAADYLDKVRLDAPTLGRTIRYALDRAHKRAQLAAAQGFLQATLDALAAHIAVLDESGAVVAVNAAWRRFAAANGFPDGACGLGLNYLAVCDVAARTGDSGAAAVAAAIRANLAGGGAAFEQEYPCHSPAEERWFAIRVTPFASGGPARAVVAHEDVTARRRAERQIRFQAQLLDQVPAAVIATDPSGVVTHWNAHATDLYGWTPGEALGRPATVLTAGSADLETGRALMARVAAGDPWSGEFPVRRKDGTTFPAFVTDAPIRDEQGRAAGFVGVSVDISDRKRAEEALKASERDYRELLDQAADAILIVDGAGRFLTVSARACALTGYAREELLAVGIADIMPAGERVEVAGRLASLADGPRTRERLVRRKDGATTPVEVSSARLADGRVQVIIRDITERKAAEVELRHAAESFASLFDATGDGLMLHDNGTILAANPTYAAMVGHELPEILGRDGFAFLTPESRAASEARSRDGDERPYEADLVCRDDTTLSVEVTGQSLRYRGRPARLVTLRDLTARRAAEAALRERDERFRLVARATNDAIWDWDLTSDAIWWNEGVQTLFDYASREVGLDAAWWYAAIHPDDRERVVGGIHAAIDGKAETWTDEYRFRRADGTHAEVLDRGFILRDEWGKAIRMLGSMQDISERKRTAAALVASEASLAAAQQLAHLGSWAADPATGVVHWSDEAFRLLGLVPQDGAPSYAAFLATVHPDDRARVDHAAGAGATEGAPRSLEYRVVHPDGAVRVVHDQSHLLVDDTGRPLQRIGAFLDITERKASEMALRRQALMFDAVSDAIIVTDLAARITDWNPGAERLFGYTREEVLGRTPALLHRPAEAVDLAARVLAGVTVEGRWEGEISFVRPDGTTGVCHTVTLPLHDERGVRLGNIGVNRDITGRKADEAALRRSERLLAEAQRIAHLGSWEYDFAADRLTWSDEVFRIAGYAPQAFSPTPERSLAAVHPDDRARVEREQRAALERGEPYMVEHRIVWPSGEVRVVCQQAEVARDAAGQSVRRIGVLLDITERKALEARLAHQATHDPLTGLPNRTLLLDRLDQALGRSRRDGGPCAVLFLDLDRFKDVNDTLGHDAGDRLLVAVTGRLRRALREGDTLARLGGDEFIVLLEGAVDTEVAAGAAERLAEALAAPLALDGHEHRVAASIGIVLSAPEHTRPEDLLRDADIAMYRAKGANGAGYALFDPTMQAALAARVALERDLRRALERGEFALHYQPVIELATGRIAKVEALLRWQHPERGNVPPDEFIPLAEEIGLIVPLGRWVLGEACRQAHAWQATGTPVAVAVNLSAREFQRPALAGEVAAALAQAGLAPSWLHLEITESLAMRDAEASVATLTALRGLGVRVAIDDFGTGYSSLAYLKLLPVDTLKIDKAFVDGLGMDEGDTAIVAAIIALAHNLGLAVVAEGVETVAQADRLCAIGCDLAQGYYFARPLPAEGLAALLGNGVPRWETSAPAVRRVVPDSELHQRRPTRSWLTLPPTAEQDVPR